MKVAVLGAGNGAHAMAADLSLAGHEVRMCELPQFEQNIVPVKVLGGIHLTGKTAVADRPGFAKVALATTDAKEAIRGAKVIMLAVPAYGQKPFLELIADGLEDGQVIVFNPGDFGALFCKKYLASLGITTDVIIAEAECLLYATRLTGPARVDVKAVKSRLGFSALPATRTKEALAAVNQLFPQFFAMDNVFFTSMNNPNFVIHPSSVLLNVSRIELMGPYKSAHYDVTPSMARIMHGVDNEKMAIAKALGLETVSVIDVLKRFYGVEGENIYEVLHNVPAYKVQHTPGDVKRDRYISEDVPYGLITLASLARQLGVECPTITTLISLATLINEEDYWSYGRKLDDLGLEGKSAEQMIEYVLKG